MKMETHYEKYHVGDEIDIKLVPNKNETKGDLQLLTLKSTGKKQSFSSTDLKEGSSVNGVLKSIKGHCMFIQVGTNGKTPQVGRLHKIETQADDFTTTKVGDRLTVKVLKVTQGKHEFYSYY